MFYSNLYARFYTTCQRVVKIGKTIFHFPYSIYYLITIAIFQILAWLQAVYIFRNLSGSFLVLHYNVDFGIDFAAEPKMIFFWPMIGLLIFFINLVVLAVLNRHKDFNLFFHLLLATAALVGLLLNLVLLSIYLINFR